MTYGGTDLLLPDPNGLVKRDVHSNHNEKNDSEVRFRRIALRIYLFVSIWIGLNCLRNLNEAVVCEESFRVLNTSGRSYSDISGFPLYMVILVH